MFTDVKILLLITTGNGYLPGNKFEIPDPIFIIPLRLLTSFCTVMAESMLLISRDIYLPPFE